MFCLFLNKALDSGVGDGLRMAVPGDDTVVAVDVIFWTSESELGWTCSGQEFFS